jgi:protein-S-isoprenylcysteine O-methyltransferase Ste14
MFVCMRIKQSWTAAPYRSVRHPSYRRLIILFIGVGVVLGV